MGAFIDLTGQRFGKLEVLGRGGEYVSPKGYRAIFWKCRCDCGKEILARGCNLKRGASLSCGCNRIEHPNRTRHGLTHTRQHSIWQGMLDRCFNPNEPCYKHYGGRGITICEEWKLFENFYEWAMNNGYRDDLSIDRIDVNGNYEPQNCRWATIRQQQNNTRRNHYLDFNGEHHTIAEWSEITGIKYHKIKDRIDKCKWSVEKALTTS